MRPNDSIFVGMELLPGWLVALVRQLRTGGEEAPPEPFALAPLLKELIAVTNSIADGKDGPFPQDRMSLHNDLQRSIAALGPESAKQEKTAIGAFRAAFAGSAKEFDALLGQPAGALKLRAAAHTFLNALAADDCRAAAWLDCVVAFKDGASMNANHACAISAHSSRPPVSTGPNALSESST